MALKTNYVDDVFEGNRKYTMTTNADSTISLVDATTYSQVGDTFGAEDINEITSNLITDIDDTFTLSVGSWNDGVYTISDARITATSIQEIMLQPGATPDQVEAWNEAVLQDYAQSVGQSQIKAYGTVPTINIPIRILFRKVK